MILANFLDNAKDIIYTNFIEAERYKMILNGLGITLEIALFATLVGVTIGIMIAVAKVMAASNKKLKPLDMICNAYLTFFRGTPVMVQILLWYFVFIPRCPAILTAIIAFGINSGAYVAEIVRAGIMGVDKGQTEAGRSLGLSSATTMRYIVFPQAFKNMLPALCNEFITLLKETSIVGYIGMMDLTRAGAVIRTQTYESYPALLLVAFIYLIIVVMLTKALGRLERKLRESDAR